MAAPTSRTLEVHFKLFGTDGVSLQSQELTHALRQRSWDVHSCASDLPDGAKGLRLPELSYQSDAALDLRRRIFQPTPVVGEGAALLQEIEQGAALIRERIERYLEAQDISLLHVRNVMSLPYNLPATVALFGLIRERADLRFVLHHHDLYWEGPNATNFSTPYPELRQLIEQVTCPDSPNCRHVLINPIAARALRERRGVQGHVIPDGFDFERQVNPIDSADFRGRLEVLTGGHERVNPDDLVVVMPARVAINKAIELAVQFVAGLNERRSSLEAAPEGLGRGQRRLGPADKIVLLLPQGEDLAESRDYFERLLAYARRLNITLAYGGKIVVPDRKYVPGDRDRFPFYSTYQTVDLVCYPPEHEGFGNQAIEAVWAKRPLAILEYPVFQAFVREHLPHFISLGDVPSLERVDDLGLYRMRGEVLARALEQAVTVLQDHALESRWAEENLPMLRAFCGIDTVCNHYLQLYASLTAGA